MGKTTKKKWEDFFWVISAMLIENEAGSVDSAFYVVSLFCMWQTYMRYTIRIRDVLDIVDIITI